MHPGQHRFVPGRRYRYQQPSPGYSRPRVAKYLCYNWQYMRQQNYRSDRRLYHHHCRLCRFERQRVVRPAHLYPARCRICIRNLPAGDQSKLGFQFREYGYPQTEHRGYTLDYRDFGQRPHFQNPEQLCHHRRVEYDRGNHPRSYIHQFQRHCTKCHADRFHRDDPDRWRYGEKLRAGQWDKFSFSTYCQ